MGFLKDGSPHYTGKKGEIILAFTIKDLIAKRYKLTTQCRGIDSKGVYYELEDPDCRFLSLEKAENEFSWLEKYRKEVHIDVIRSVYQTDLRVSASSARERKDLRISLKWNSGSPVQLGNLSFKVNALTSLQLQRFLDVVYRWRVLRKKWINEEKTTYPLVTSQSKKWVRYFIDLLLKDEKAQSDLMEAIKKRFNNEKDQLCIVVGEDSQIMYADYLYRFLFESINNPKFLPSKDIGKMSCLIQLSDPFILRLRDSFPNTTEKSYSNLLYPKIQLEAPALQKGKKE